MRLAARGILVAVCLALALSGCGGGGGGGGASAGYGPSSAPYVLGSVISFPTGAVPTGFTTGSSNTAVSVQVLSTEGGSPVTNALVTVNGTTLPYVAANQDYETSLDVAPGGAISVSVVINGIRYSTSGTQASQYPVIAAPLANATLAAAYPNPVSWASTALPANWLYALGLFSYSGNLLWPTNNSIQIVQPPATGFVLPGAGLVPTGTELFLVGAVTALRLPNTSPNSGLVIGGFTYVPVTVTAGTFATLTGLQVVPANPALTPGTAQQLSATGIYSDGSTRDFTAAVTWSSSDGSVATVSPSGLVTAVAAGSANITAATGAVTGTTSVGVYVPAAATTGWTTFQGDAAHTGFVDVTLDATKFAQVWTWARPPGDPEPVGGINSVATGAGKVFVTKDIYFGQGAVYALNETDGTAAWTSALGAMASEGPPALANGNVLVPTVDPTEHCAIWALDALTGTQRFQATDGCQWSSFFAPTVYGGALLQTSQTGAVSSYSMANGGRQWFAPARAGDQATPAADANYVYQYGQQAVPAALQVYDRITGAVVASITDPFLTSNTNYSVFGAPMIGSPGHVVAFSGGGFSGRAASSSEQYGSRPLVSYDIAARQYAWRSANTYLTHPAVAGGVIYAAGTAPAQLEALSETDGHLLWSWPLPAGDAAFHRNVVVTRNLVFVSTDLNIYAVDLASHQAVWRYPKPGMIAISPNSMLYLVTGATASDGNLVAIKLN
jgi:Bacterial Ig-like domain (group 2)/PQQ-like domain